MMTLATKLPCRSAVTFTETSPVFPWKVSVPARLHEPVLPPTSTDIPANVNPGCTDEMTGCDAGVVVVVVPLVVVLLVVVPLVVVVPLLVVVPLVLVVPLLVVVPLVLVVPLVVVVVEVVGVGATCRMAVAVRSSRPFWERVAVTV
jgi:hypothetical protein